MHQSQADYQALPHGPDNLLQRTAHQHNTSQFRFEAAPAAHDRVINEEKSRLLQLSRLHGTCLHWLRAFSHSTAWRAGLATTGCYVVLHIVNASINGTSVIQDLYDQQHYSDGAKPSQEQQLEDHDLAVRDLSLFFGLTPVLIPALFLIMYWWLDMPKYMHGYDAHADGLPDYGQFDEVEVLNQGKDQIDHLFTKWHGLIGIAHMIASFNRRLEHELPVQMPVPVLPSQEIVESTEAGPSAAPSPQPQIITANLESQPLPQHETRASTHPHRVVFSVPINENILSQFDDPSVLHQFNAALAAHDLTVRICERLNKHEFTVMVVHGTGDIYPRIEALERQLREGVNLSVGLPQDLTPLLESFRREITRISQRQTQIEQRIFIAPELFAPLLVFYARQRMSAPGIDLGIGSRATFVNTLLVSNPTEDENKNPALATLLFLFFNYHRSATRNSGNYQREDQASFTALQDPKKALVLQIFYQGAREYQPLADEFNQLPFSNRTRRCFFELWCKANDQGLLTKATLGTNQTFYDTALTQEQKTHRFTLGA